MRNLKRILGDDFEGRASSSRMRLRFCSGVSCGRLYFTVNCYTQVLFLPDQRCVVGLRRSADNPRSLAKEFPPSYTSMARWDYALTRLQPHIKRTLLAINRSAMVAGVKEARGCGGGARYRKVAACGGGSYPNMRESQGA